MGLRRGGGVEHSHFDDARGQRTSGDREVDLAGCRHLERGGHTRRHDHRICTERRLGDGGKNRGGAGTGRGPDRHP